MLFHLTRTKAEKAQRRLLKELEREAKAQCKDAAKEHKAQEALVKQQQKAVKKQQKAVKKQQKAIQRQQKEALKSHKKAVQAAKKAAKRRTRVAQKTAKERQRRARFHSTVTAPAFAKSTSCFVCGKTFTRSLSRRRHHCRQCRESCCLHCMSPTRRPVPFYGLDKPQKVCVVCDTLVLNEERPREPVEALAALAAANRTTSRRPHSAPLPPTDVTVAMPLTRRGHGRSKSKSSSLWTLPIRPLLKKKKSAEQLRNRTMDFNLQNDKHMVFSGRSIELQPQTMAPPMP
ncbi:unnamed protein product [Peronospora effusa]|uniref:FYVE-type domain-containing protein n=1 Tax=Peronospora effusa TaxID=542832 RepID=A0A3M6VBC3_9STRA|nr:hypothetical protein DD238_007290 [Peronospora effusa]CAI5702042.1 unnamed protein product [Peronospora effusa]